jgi:uncharacterized protein (TIGR02284 family)
MASQTEEAVSVLNELIETCEDGATGYKKAAEDVQDVSLKTLFSEYSSQRALYSSQLRSAVEAHGGKPSTSGHVAGALHRGWMSVKEVAGNKDKAIIDECEAGEDRAMKAYKEAIEKNLPGIESDLINRQFVGVQAAHNKLRNLKHSGERN